MTATFLVTVTLDATSSIDGISEQINELLSDELPIVEVKPWTRPSLQTESLLGVDPHIL